MKVTTVWVGCKISNCECVVEAQFTLIQCGMARGCHALWFQLKNRIALSYFSHLWMRHVWDKSHIAFILFTVSPIFRSTCYLFTGSLRKPYIPFSHHSLTHASWLHYTPAKPSLWLCNPVTHSTETSKAFALLPASYPSQAPQGKGINNTGDFPV